MTNLEYITNLRAERDELQTRTERQAKRIRYLEGATNHACGTPLSLALTERDELRAALAELEPIADRMGGAAPVYDLLHAATQKARAALAKTKEAK